MNPVQKAERVLARVFIKSVRENGGCTPVEADDCLNTASRRLVKAFIQENGGKAWVGIVNKHGKDRPILWEVDEKSSNGRAVYNFEADYVVPAYDAELERLVLHYNNDGLQNARTNIDAVYKRVDELGGSILTWA